MFGSTTVVISNSLFISRPAVADAPLNVTKSPTIAPWAESVTVIVALPFVVANGLLSPACVDLTGVIS